MPCTKFSEDSLTQMFATFQEFDVDRSGFISVDNLKAICEALGDELATITEAQLVNMIMEVAILTGHENDGKLSFRDYCALHAYEVLLHKKKGDTDEEAEMSDGELTTGEAPFAPWTYDQWLSNTATEAEMAKNDQAPAVEAARDPATRQRGSSFAVLAAVAVSRIAQFEKLVQDEAITASKTAEETRRKNKFASKLAKFKRLESGEPTAGESGQAQALKAKLAAFEAAAKNDPVAFKTSWKNVHDANEPKWRERSVRAVGAVAPPRSLADLP